MTGSAREVNEPVAEAVLYYDSKKDGISVRYPIASDESNCVTQVYRHPRGSLELRQETDGSRFASDIVARLQAFPPTFLFESLVEGACIRPADGGWVTWLSKREALLLPQSKDEGQYFHVLLRPGDLIEFTRDSFELRFTVEPIAKAPQASSDTAQNRLQHQMPTKDDESTSVAAAATRLEGDGSVLVRSSDQQSEPELVRPQRQVADMETESEDGSLDLDGEQSFIKSAKMANDLDDTPATDFTVGEVKETPAKRHTSFGNEGQQPPYSTAPEMPEGTPETRLNGIHNVDVTPGIANDVLDPASPLANKHESQISRSPLRDTSHKQAITTAGKGIAGLPNNKRDGSPGSAGDLAEPVIGANLTTYSKRGHAKKAQATSSNQMKRKATVSDSVQGDEEHSGDGTDAEEDSAVVGAAETDIVGVEDAAQAAELDINMQRSKQANAIDMDGETSPKGNASDGQVIDTELPSSGESDASEEAANSSTVMAEHKGKKRGSTAVSREDDDEQSVQQRSGKRAKTASTKTEEDEAPLGRRSGRISTATPATGKSSSKLEMSPPSTTTKGRGSAKTSKASSQNTGDEIIVAPASSSSKKGARGSMARTPGTPSVQVQIPRETASGSPDSSSAAMSGRPPKVLFSHSDVNKDKALVSWLKKQGALEIDEVPSKRANFICVVPSGHLATTAKVLRTLALGKLVVTDDWVTDSKEEGQLLEPDDYVHEALQDTIRLDRSTLFKGYRLYFTKQLAASYGSGWQSIRTLCIEAGADAVESGNAASGHSWAALGKTLFFGATPDDLDVKILSQEKGHIIYNRNMLTQSVMDGELKLDNDDFIIKPSNSPLKLGRGSKR
ncbi:hypothetical protein KC332_g3628 [Hortaea werneckii]|uniref:BRCT domain-containing protein n=2 Tax=Hortaea werneckii TaxID=91943 RepID=A0A3M7HMS0_HORWE|nr:hypothetical protein KC350_g11689 [Hortaea werneckii]OTA35264.1 hypothetical protein BTJ68_04377 [Hortaea werneckii EXF-2000]KAI6834270.1 hypothetical protein KC358_g5878 [Hortaea werneckii]KAI6924438.1 hypothetical protein KC341_g14062 [Hortaea werneckii]KAI6935781.1 hypothetical protein KC348_g6179 [Hortaea werneckii]